MDGLRIQLFGGIQLEQSDNAALPLQPTVQIFLAYLLLNRSRYHCREVLSGLFWGDKEESHARRCLSTTLWRLRQEIEPEGTPRGTYVLTTSSGEIGFNNESERYWLDVAAFESRAIQGLSRPLEEMGSAEATLLQEAADLYTGDLMEGIYADWVINHRERLRGQYIKCLGRLMRYHTEQQAYDQGIYYGRKILELDPLREQVHRQLMRLHIQRGERPQALKQYQTCRQILAEELDIQPMPETQAIYNQLISEITQPVSIPVIPLTQDPPKNLQQALTQLDQALVNLETVRGQLFQAKKAVNDMLSPPPSP